MTQQQDSALDSWVRLLRGHASVTRAMSAELVADHGLTINDYEALLHLSRAEDGRMRRVDLAGRLILTASGVTRLLDGLEVAGLVERASCSSDRRVIYAVLTESGRTKLREASESHLAGVRAFFEARYSREELDQLAGLLGRLPGVAEAVGEDCAA
ncbi:MAG: MarR family winged helix-turn-helix transcriptional regulator [Gaiellaceae bacterium]